MTALAIQHKASILERVAAGHRLTDIAASLGITQPAISKQLAQDPDYLQAREYGLEARISQWEAELETIGPDSPQVMLARARELLSHARWRAEREAPHRWGQRTHVSVEHVGDLADRLRAGRERLRALRERVIENEPSENGALCQTPAEPDMSRNNNGLAAPGAQTAAPSE